VNCKSCNKTLNDSQKFCDDCGAKVIYNRLTPKVLAAQINEQFLSLDNKFLQTFISLTKKPEDVIDGYINGVRKRFIGVIPYYALGLTVLGFQMFMIKSFFPEYLEVSNRAMSEGFLAGSGGKGKELADYFTKASEKINDYQGVLFSVLMPFLAIGTWIMYLDKRKYNYTEHLVINLYSNSQIIIFNAVLYLGFALLTSIDFVTVSAIITPITIIYGTFVFKRLYASSFFNALIRYLGAFVIYMITFFVLMVALIIILILYLKLKN
jgi:hypothetical protein